MQVMSDFAQTLTVAINESFLLGFDQEPEVYPRIFEEVHLGPDDIYCGQETVIIGADEPREIEWAQEHEFEDIGEGWIAFWKCKLYQNGFEVDEPTQRAWRNQDAAIRFVQKRAMDMGLAFKRRRDRICADVFNNGTLTAGSLTTFDGTWPGIQYDLYPKFIYDGLPFFDTAHPLYNDSSTTFSNHTASSALTHANLEAAIINMTRTNAKGELNEEIVIRPNALVIPPNLRFTAQRILESQLQSGTGNNDINTLLGELEPIPWQKLTDNDAWFVGCKKMGLRAIDAGAPMAVLNVDKFRGKGVLQWSMTDVFGTLVNQWRYWEARNTAAA